MFCFCFKQEEQNRGKPNWEHLNEELHVLITVEDTVNRAEVKMAKAMEEVKKLLVPAVSMPTLAFPPYAHSSQRNIKMANSEEQTGWQR